jgi:hypothetical protein
MNLMNFIFIFEKICDLFLVSVSFKFSQRPVLSGIYFILVV